MKIISQDKADITHFLPFWTNTVLSERIFFSRFSLSLSSPEYFPRYFSSMAVSPRAYFQSALNSFKIFFYLNLCILDMRRRYSFLVFQSHLSSHPPPPSSPSSGLFSAQEAKPVNKAIYVYSITVHFSSPSHPHFLIELSFLHVYSLIRSSRCIHFLCTHFLLLGLSETHACTHFVFFFFCK